MQEPKNKYIPFPAKRLPDRIWPDKEIAKPPIWCSVDLRDGNQALVCPMSILEKMELFKLLLSLGFNQIEVGFPSASSIEFDFMRTLVQKKMIPNDVSIQVLTQARDSLIKKTFDSLAGVKKTIIHLYNSTSIVQRNQVFQKTKKEILDLAVFGVREVKRNAATFRGEVQLEYSPESFTGTEIEYALDVCHAVMEEWKPTKENPIILNLPATVELYGPHVYADQIEWFHRHIQDRDSVIISLHTHNDRGSAVAATELGLLAGADRVEGTLFGNGERTGNVDLVTLALNLYTHGIHPNLDLSNLHQIQKICEKVTHLPIHARHPYVGELVYTAFSGSHQDAINKGMSYRSENKRTEWDVPYLPIDSQDVGRSYEAIIRINSQSGKGGVAYILEEHYGYSLPKTMYVEFSQVIQQLAEIKNQEIDKDLIGRIFREEYLDRNIPFAFDSFVLKTFDEDIVSISIRLGFLLFDKQIKIEAIGNGPIDACQKAFVAWTPLCDFSLVNYREHSLSEGANAQAITYLQLKHKVLDMMSYGVGIDCNINISCMKAILSALNRMIRLSNNQKHIQLLADLVDTNIK